jgi:hypothetical protein
MATILPILSESDLNSLPSQAEAKFYRAIRDQLPSSDIVLHSRTFVAKNATGNMTDGEADFVLFSKDYGILIIEVKGGGVSHNPETGWLSVDRHQISHSIKNPFLQAKSQKFSILNHLKSYRIWNQLKLRVTAGHAVMFTDISDCTSLVGIDSPIEIIGSKNDLSDIRAWTKKVLQFWSKQSPTGFGSAGMDIVNHIFCKPVSVKPLMRDLLSSDDEVRINLTNEQAKVLRTLSRHKRAGICGPAGTGKTVLAVEKAKMLNEMGKKVLLLCYNKPLGASIFKQFDRTSEVHVFTFHQYCEHLINSARKKFNIDYLLFAKSDIPGADLFDEVYPLAATYAIEKFGEIAQYDAVIIDEGQDFGEEYWLTIEMSIKSTDESWLYIFFDENQKLYKRNSSFPISEDHTFPLTKNCRNAKPIHNLAYNYYIGDQIDDSNIVGTDPVLLIDDAEQIQAKRIYKEIRNLIQKETISADDIAVLVIASPKNEYYRQLNDEIKNQNLIKFSFEEHNIPHAVIVDTVKHFKGLERNVVFLWIDDLSLASERELYVGISRAKSILYIVGNSSVRSIIEV